jgi:peptide/nickel transport system permease protein
MGLLRFIAKRLAFAVFAMVFISFLIFGLLFVSPGSPEQVLLGASNPTPATIAAVRAKYHLGDPFLSQYWRWLRGACHGDLGRSIQTTQTVTSTIRGALPITSTLAVMALAIVLAVGIPLGLVSGVRNGSFIDRLITVTSTIAVSAPVFAVGIILLYVFGVGLRWFPVYGAGAGVFDRVYHLLLPAITLATGMVALIARQTRASALNVDSQDYLAFARARGLPARTIWIRYIFRNSALPVVTSAGIVLAYTLTGAVLVEQTFSLPGIGSLIVNAVNNKDIPVVQGVALLAAAVVVVVNLVVDLCCLLLDPRVRKAALA